MAEIHWLLEDVFSSDRLAEAAAAAGHRVSAWRDEWWSNERFPVQDGERALFHGSLNNAAKLHGRGWAFCDAQAFRCSRWYAEAKPWLVHPRYAFSTVRALCEDPIAVAQPLGSEEQVFVRPDSPLKAFSGRVVALQGLTPAHLDHGFYFEDLDLPIVLAPTQQIGEEWRFVVAQKKVLTGSGYSADRAAGVQLTEGASMEFAQRVASALAAPEPMYVLDVAQTQAGLRLMELNPFSGADLYGCDPAPIVDAAQALLSSI